MSQSNYITIVLFALIGLVFIIDFFKKRKEDSLEKSVEKFVKKEKTGKKSWFSLKSFFWLYPIYFIVIPLFILYLERNMSGGLYELIFDEKGYLHALESLLEGPQEYWLGIYPLIIIHLFLYAFSKYSNWILKRKKNITFSILLIISIKILVHYFFENHQKVDLCDRYPTVYVRFQDFFNAIFSDYIYYDNQHNCYNFSQHRIIDYVGVLDARLDLFIPVTIVFLIVVWFFNDKIKAQ